MATPVLVLHSSGPQGPGEGTEPFATRLREELGPEFEVSFPIMPSLNDPHYEPWSERIGQILEEAEEPLIVVGHSLGGSVFLKRVAETGRYDPVIGLVLVAVPVWGREAEWEREWALPEGWPDAETTLPPTFLFHSRDDDVIPFSHLDGYAALLPDASVHPLDGYGHLYDRGDLSVILDAIRDLAAG
jgi:predicted alpha/beta hydrolase family esterase